MAGISNNRKQNHFVTNLSRVALRLSCLRRSHVPAVARRWPRGVTERRGRVGRRHQTPLMAFINGWINGRGVTTPLKFLERRGNGRGCSASAVLASWELCTGFLARCVYVRSAGRCARAGGSTWVVSARRGGEVGAWRGRTGRGWPRGWAPARSRVHGGRLGERLGRGAVLGGFTR
jgi:hypothetical protein